MLRALLPAVAAGLVATLSLALPAQAQTACRVPADLAPAAVQPVPPEDVAQVPIRFHLLAIAWGPQWCRSNAERGPEERLDCETERGFFLHGLWPNGRGKPYPRYCAPVGVIDTATVRRMYCRTPSAALLQHEWQAHGACGWTDPKVYFRQAAELYDRLEMPKLETIPKEALTVGAVRRAFVARNPWLRSNMIIVSTNKEGALAEVRICHDLKFKPATCLDGVFPPDATPLRLARSKDGRF